MNIINTTAAYYAHQLDTTVGHHSNLAPKPHGGGTWGQDQPSLYLITSVILLT